MSDHTEVQSAAIAEANDTDFTVLFVTGMSGAGRSTAANVLEDDGDGQATIEEVSDEALSVLDEVPTDGEVHVVDVPGLGGYRVAATTDGSAEKVVAGLPTSEVDDVVATLVRWIDTLSHLGRRQLLADGQQDL